jgi:hypothetical protein
LFQRKHAARGSSADRNYQLLTIRVPLALANALREASARRFEPASVITRRALERELADDRQLAGGVR